MRKQGQTVLSCVVLLLSLNQAAVRGQSGNPEVVRTNTRVVSVDVLVQDKKSHEPVTGLSLDAFHVLDNGRERKLSYFGPGGLARQPLALALTFELNTSAILYLAKPEVMEQIISALGKLNALDEVAVLQTWYEPDAKDAWAFQLRSRIVQPFTRDRDQTAAALRDLQQFAAQNVPHVKWLFSTSAAFKKYWKKGIWDGMKGAAGVPWVPPMKISVAPDFQDIIDRAPACAQERPDSLLAVVSITDDLGAEPLSHSTDKAEKLIAAGVMVNGVVVQKNLQARGVDITGTVLSPALLARFHTISYYSEQTGGQITRVSKPAEFAGGISNLVGGLAARYSVGFRLGDDERDNGKMHKLSVTVSVPNKKNDDGRLMVSARRGYYLPTLQENAAR
jgi:VWFA-related protein